MSAGSNRASFVSSLMDKTIKSSSRRVTAYSVIKTICLYDWWLVHPKEESKNGLLGVSGIGSIDGQTRRVFYSSAISERIDMITVETVDGIRIRLSGFINKSATQSNGFSVEVCNQFHFGFPSYWKDYASFNENNSQPSMDSSKSSSLPTEMNDIPVTLIRDILILGRGDPSIQMRFVKNAFDDLLHNNVLGRGDSSMQMGFVKNAFDDLPHNNGVDVTPRKMPRKAWERKKSGGRTGVMTRSMMKQKLLSDNAGVSDSKCAGVEDDCQKASTKRKKGDELGPSVVRRSCRIKALRNKSAL